jgi:hypothetical protein
LADNKLKEIEVKALEEAIAKAVSDLTGWNYGCSIKSVQYNDVGVAELDLTLDTSDWLSGSINHS